MQKKRKRQARKACRIKNQIQNACFVFGPIWSRIYAWATGISFSSFNSTFNVTFDTSPVFNSFTNCSSFPSWINLSAIFLNFSLHIFFLLLLRISDIPPKLGLLSFLQCMHIPTAYSALHLVFKETLDFVIEFVTH